MKLNFIRLNLICLIYITYLIYLSTKMKFFCRKCNISSFFFPTESGLFPLLTLNIYKKLPQKQNFDRGKIFTRYISVQFSRLNIVIFRPQGKKLLFLFQNFISLFLFVPHFCYQTKSNYY